MQFSDATNLSGIVQEVDALCDTSATTYPLKSKTRRINTALETLISKIINADGVWQWDDTNRSDLPVGTGDLVAGQSSYSFAAEYLQIENIKILDSNENYYLIQPIDQSQVTYPLEDHLENDGLPQYYDKVGDTIRLYPAPAAADVTVTAGIKVQFKRTASLFTAAGTDTTAVPGIASPYHILLAYMAAIPYCMTYKKDRVALYEKRVDEGIREMIKHYSYREKDRKKVMHMDNQLNYR